MGTAGEVRGLGRFVRMSDEHWRRHANPWSVWTRMLGLAPIIGSLWFRDTLGWWTVAILVASVGWMWLNPRAFRAVTTPRSWAEMGIYGEKMWVDKAPAARPHRAAITRIALVAVPGTALLAWGLYALSGWPVLFGLALILLSQMWQIDRFVQIYRDSRRQEPA